MKKCLGSLILCLAVVAMIGCGRSPETDAPTTETQPVPAGPKPSHASYSLQWVSNDVPATIAAGTTTEIHVSAKNTGDWPWNDPFAANPNHPDGTYAIRLSCGWVGADDKPLPPDSTRGELTAPVPPGQTANFAMKVKAPKEPGSYKLQLDLVEELVFYFSSKGNEKLTVPVTVK